MAEPIVFAVSTCVSTDPNTGLIVRVCEGEPWAAGDPFVKARPDLFADDPARIRRTIVAAPVVEKATKVPGEKRVARRAES